MSFERFTDRARKVMALAHQEAQRFNHEYIGTEHILLGLVKEGSGVGANVLKHVGVELDNVRAEVEKLVASGPEVVAEGKIPPTPRAKKVIEYATQEARELNHNYVGTEHLLLGFLRERDGVAAQVLMNLGLNLEEVRKGVVDLLGASPVAASEPAENSRPAQVSRGDVRQVVAVSKETVALIGRAMGLAGSGGATEVMPWHVLLALVDDREVVAALVESSEGFSAAVLRDKIEQRFSRS